MSAITSNRCIKHSGYITRSDDNTLEIGIRYGADTAAPVSEKVIITEGTVTAHEKKDVPSFTKLTNHVTLLTLAAIKELTIFAATFKPLHSKTKILFFIDSQNNIDGEIEHAQNYSVTSFYKTTKNPNRPQAREQIKLQTYRTIKSKTNLIKTIHPRIHFIDYSSESSPANTEHPVSILNGSEFVKKIAEQHSNESYKTALINHIMHTLQLKKTTPLLYQSLCVPMKNNSQFAHYGAEYIYRNPDFFLEELGALHALKRIYGYNKIQISIPNIKSVEGIIKIKSIMQRNGFTRSPSFQLLLNLHVPATFFLLDSILAQGIDGVVLDLDHASQLLLGMDSELSYKQQGYSNPAVNKIIQLIADKTKKYALPLYISLAQPTEKMLSVIPEAHNIHIIAPRGYAAL